MQLLGRTIEITSPMEAITTNNASGRTMSFPPRTVITCQYRCSCTGLANKRCVWCLRLTSSGSHPAVLCACKCRLIAGA